MEQTLEEKVVNFIWTVNNVATMIIGKELKCIVACKSSVCLVRHDGKDVVTVEKKEILVLNA